MRTRMALLSAFLMGLFAFACAENEVPIDETEKEFTDDKPQNESILQLTANDCFFYPIGNLLAEEESREGGTLFNKGWKLSHISGWSEKGDTIIWALKNCVEGNLIVTPEMSVPQTQNGSEINVLVNGQIKSIVLKSTASVDNYKKQNKVSFDISKAGNYKVKLFIKNSKSTGNVGDLINCHIGGTAVKYADIYKRRWRPLAVHCQWRSSKNPQEVVLAVHENIIETTDIHMYQPTTTPFGYTGSTWEPKTQTFGGYNFSLWSYGANDQEPPLEQFSHLIAVGPGYTFGEYGHEGTGVKPRGENPYKDHKTNRQVLAVRKEPGIPYDTYYSYYLHPETNNWTLYGCGRKYNKKEEITYLTTGAFVEEPGPPTRTRNGHIMREVHFTGWLFDKNNQWYQVDEMHHNGDDSSLSYKNWGVKNKRFFMQMGGIDENVVEKDIVPLNNPITADNRPDYLKDEMLEDLYKLPVGKIEALDPTVNEDGSIHLNFNLNDVGEVIEAALFWGTKNALTFDYKWENKKAVQVKNGKNKFSLDNLKKDTTYYYQIRIINNKGTMWMLDTQKIELNN